MLNPKGFMSPLKFYALVMPSLVGGILASWLSPVQAAESFGNTSIIFEEDTVIEFEFLESNGAYQSILGVVNLETGQRTPLLQEVMPSDTPQTVTLPSDYEDDSEPSYPTSTNGVTPIIPNPSNTDDFFGSAGRTVPEPLPEFLFEANTPYAFYLESYYNGQRVNILYSTNTQNPNGTQQVRFEGGVNSLDDGGVVIRWDDTGATLVPRNEQDRDFDDFIIRAGGHLACP